MILDQIVLTNFGIYKGEHLVTLTPKAKKPIILFGAYNGSGKTTFLEALQLALYGKLAKTAGRGKLGYDEYLRALINRSTPKNIGSGLKLNFRTRQDGKEEKIQINRTWYESGNNIKENFEVIRNNVFDPIASERWSEFVEEIMPSQISELFFFDGEKIEGLADPSSSSSLLRSGIYSLLGINSIDNLIKSLTQIERKKTLELSKSADKAIIENEEKIAKDLSLKKEKIDYERANLRIDIDKVKNKIKTNEEEMKLSGADLLQERHKLQQTLLVLNEQKKTVSTQLIELSSGLAPLLLIKSLIDELREKATNSSGHNNKTLLLVEKEFNLLTSRVIQKEFQDLTSNGPASATSDTLANLINNEVINRLMEIRKDVLSSSIDINLNEIPTADELNQTQELVSQKIVEANKLDIEIDILSKKLMAVPNEDKVKDIIGSLNNNQKELIKLEAKIEIVTENITSIEDELLKIKKVITDKLTEIASQETELEVNKRVITHIKKSKETLELFKNSLINKHIQSLSSEITNCFRLLHRKNKLELQFYVNISDYSLTIKKSNNEEISAKSLSAGERQLLAVAILWALAKSSGKTLPTVIDTPLGRLDGPHRQKLISNYFPNASSQVLIFSTDEEVTPEHYESLKSHIAAEYKINYNEESESSSFELGYF